MDKILAIKILMKWNELANVENEVKGPWPTDSHIFADAARVIEKSSGSLQEVGYNLWAKQQDTLEIKLAESQTKTGTPQDFKVGRHAFKFRSIGGKVYQLYRTTADGESTERCWVSHVKANVKKKMRSLEEQYPQDSIAMLVHIQEPYKHVIPHRVKDGRDAAIGVYEINQPRQNKTQEQHLEI